MRYGRDKRLVWSGGNLFKSASKQLSLFMDSIFLREQINVPTDLPTILTEWSKAVIRNQPRDLYEFSANYFAALANTSLGEEKYTVAPFEVKPDTLRELSSLLHSSDPSQSLSLTRLQIVAQSRSVYIPPDVTNSVLDLLSVESNTVSWPAFVAILTTLATSSFKDSLRLLVSCFESVFGDQIPLPVLLTSIVSIVERDADMKHHMDTLVTLTGDDDWKSTTFSSAEFLDLPEIRQLL
ncbi:hypothetical protein GEMRC1_003207 [Eukaryota sp. GEM-RC1]